MVDNVDEPSTFHEVSHNFHYNEWMDAMKEEFNSLKENNTWNLVKLPPNKKAIGCKWIYKLKESFSGENCQFKARLVAQGFNQKFGVDYNEVFAPVVKQSTLKILLSIATQKNYKLQHIDIKTAFLYGALDDEVYMRQPEGFEEKAEFSLQIKQKYLRIKTISPPMELQNQRGSYC